MVRGCGLSESVGFSWPSPTTSMLHDDAPTLFWWFGITIFVAVARLWGVVRLEKRGVEGEGEGEGGGRERQHIILEKMFEHCYKIMGDRQHIHYNFVCVFKKLS